jgi:prepilin peptidase CpaA
MNLIAQAPLWLLVILFLALLAAAAEDALRLRISNVTCAVVLVGAIVAMALRGFAPDLWQNAVVFVAALALGTLAFARGWLGGGDVKLLAALGAWVNFEGAGYLFSAIFISGGVLGAIFLLRRALPGRRAAHRQLPYGVAIAIGALISIGIQGTHQRSTQWRPGARAHSSFHLGFGS